MQAQKISSKSTYFINTKYISSPQYKSHTLSTTTTRNQLLHIAAQTMHSPHKHTNTTYNKSQKPPHLQPTPQKTKIIQVVTCTFIFTKKSHIRTITGIKNVPN